MTSLFVNIQHSARNYQLSILRYNGTIIFSASIKEFVGKLGNKLNKERYAIAIKVLLMRKTILLLL